MAGKKKTVQYSHQEYIGADSPTRQAVQIIIHFHMVYMDQSEGSLCLETEQHEVTES